MQNIQNLHAIPDDVLLHRLAALVDDSRHTEADLVAHIAEVVARKLYAREATPSMFQYCTERLHLSGAEAYLRIAAGRAAREHPIILTMLADGRLHLTAVALLAPHLTQQNRDVLLTRATHRTKREIEELVAEIAPRPDAPALTRKLPGRVASGVWSFTPSANPQSATPSTTLPPTTPSSTASSSSASSSTGALSAAESTAATTPATQAWATRAPTTPALVQPSTPARSALPSTVVGSLATAPGLSAPAVTLLALPQHTSPTATVAEELRLDGVVSKRLHGVVAGQATIRALSPARYRVQFTASADLRDKLERLQDLMRSSLPDGDLTAIIDIAVTEKLERLEARRFGRTQRPRKTLSDTDTTPWSRSIPAAVKRTVDARDEGRCAYVDEKGRRCTASVSLQFHHRHTFATGGDHSLANVSLLCTGHNRYLAEIDYGRQAMDVQVRGVPEDSGRSAGALSDPHRGGP